MPDLTSLENLYLIVGFLAPGLIVLFVRSQFVTGRIAPDLGAVPLCHRVSHLLRPGVSVRRSRLVDT